MIAAMVGLSDSSGGKYANSDGIVSIGGSIYTTPHAERLGIDLDDATLRAELVTAWCAVTERRIRDRQTRTIGSIHTRAQNVRRPVRASPSER